ARASGFWTVRSHAGLGCASRDAFSVLDRFPMRQVFFFSSRRRHTRLAPELENTGYDGQGRMKLPREILFDLDDMILVAFGPAQSQWQRTITVFADRLGSIEATVIVVAIQAASAVLWFDPARHKYWRHRTGA